MKYKVLITETLKMLVAVEADNKSEAEQAVSDKWHNSEYVLDAENFSEVSFRAEVDE